MSEWISVEDRLPKNNQIVLCVNKCGEMSVCKFDKTEWEYFFMLFNTSHQECHITHWVPLPEPPK